MSQQEILERAIQKAIDGGWTNGIGEKDMLGRLIAKSRETQEIDPIVTDLVNHFWFARMYPSIIFNRDFAKALFGDEEVDEFGQSMKHIQLWAKQVAVVHLGKKYEIRDGEHHLKLLEAAGAGMRDSDNFALVTPEHVEYKIQDAMAAIPFETHKLHELDVITGTKAWQFHLQQMVIAEDPIAYLGEHLGDGDAA